MSQIKDLRPPKMTKVEKIHKLSGGAPISGLPEIGTSSTQVGYSSTCSAPSRSTSSFAGSGACDVRSRDFLFRPCSAPVISAGFPGLRAVCRFLHPPPPIYRDLQGLLRRWPLPTLDLNPMARACYGDAKVTSDIRAMNHWGIVREPDPTRQAASVL
jgi:hypothetical protein